MNSNGNGWIIKAATGALIVALIGGQAWNWQETVENGKKLAYEDGYRAGKIAALKCDNN